MKIRLIDFCNDVKQTRCHLTPLTGQELTHCVLLLLTSQVITASEGLCLELLLQGLPRCHHTLLQNRGQVYNQPDQEETATSPT